MGMPLLMADVIRVGEVMMPLLTVDVILNSSVLKGITIYYHCILLPLYFIIIIIIQTDIVIIALLI